MSASKIFGTKPQETLYDASYINYIMYAKAMPMYGDGNKDKDELPYDNSKDACDTDNFNDNTDDEIIVS